MTYPKILWEGRILTFDVRIIARHLPGSAQNSKLNLAYEYKHDSDAMDVPHWKSIYPHKTLTNINVAETALLELIDGA